MKTIRVKARYLEKRGISTVAEGIFKRMANGMAEETDLCRPIYQCCRPYLKAVVRPGAEFHLAALIVKGEPGNVYLASALEYAGRHV